MGRISQPRLLTHTTLDVLDVVVVRPFALLMHPTVCSALNSDHRPILFDSAFLTFVQNLLNRPVFSRIHQPHSCLVLETCFWGIPW